MTSAPQRTSARFEKKLPTASKKRVTSLPSEAVVTAPRVRPPSQAQRAAHARVREPRGDDVGIQGDALQRRDPDDEHPRRAGGGHAGLRVLERGAPVGSDAEPPRG